jgi:predicted phosphodiesterase
MRTLVVSDLHLGMLTEADVLRRGAPRERLLARLADVERLVLLGDVLELRHGPVRDALAVARPVLRAIGAALPAGAEVLLVPGNHDHAIVGPWLEARGRTAAPRPLGLEQRLAPRTASPLAEALARALRPATLRVAYPGAWLREDVYATHGHYLDIHGTVPTFERLAAGAMGRLVGSVPAPAAEPDDYEAVLAPIYAWIHATAQRAAPGRAAAGAGGAVRVYQLVSGGGRRPIGARVLAGLFPLAVAFVNRAGLGPVRANLAGPELRRSALRGIGEAMARLGVDAEHVVFGHSHRAGPLEGGDDPEEWLTASGAALHNAGAWVFEDVFLRGHGPESGFWPGGAIALDADGPPRLERLLGDVPADELQAPDAAPDEPEDDV